MKISALATILAGVSSWLISAPVFAQDDIEMPAGDIAEAEEDPQMEEDLPAEDAGLEIPADGSPMDADSMAEFSPNADTEKGKEEAEVGPVWESYNSNLKSVAQEVTKGLRVEDVVEPPTEYHYAAFGKADPFLPPMRTKPDAEIASVSGLEVPIVSPLQRYDISQLSLVGIWQLSTGERKALVMTPGEEGQTAGIIVRGGDSIGTRAGKILAIGDSFLTVREFKLAVDGTRQYEDIQMIMGERDPSKIPGKIRFTPGADKTQVILEGEQGVVGGEAAGRAQTNAVAPVAPPVADSRIAPVVQNPTIPQGATAAPGGAPTAALAPGAQTVPSGQPAASGLPTGTAAPLPASAAGANLAPASQAGGVPGGVPQAPIGQPGQVLPTAGGATPFGGAGK